MNLFIFYVIPKYQSINDTDNIPDHCTVCLLLEIPVNLVEDMYAYQNPYSQYSKIN